MLKAISEFNLKEGISAEQLTIIDKFIEADPEGALETLYTKDNIRLRLEFTKICEMFSNSGEGVLIQWLNEELPKLTPDKHIQALYWADLIMVLAKDDPEKAIKTMSLSDLDNKEMNPSVVRLFYTTSERDLDKALSLLDLLPPTFKEAAYCGLSYSLAKSDPSRSLEFVSMIQDPKDRVLASSYVFDQWLKTNPEDASEQLIKFKGQFEEIGLSNLNSGGDLIKSLCDASPGALRELLFQIVPTAQNKVLFEKSIGEMARNNIELTLATIDDLPKSAFKDKLTMQAFSVGEPPVDLSGVHKIIDRLNGQTRRAAIEGLAQRFSSASIEEVLAGSNVFQGKDKSAFVGAALVNMESDNMHDLVRSLANSNLDDVLTMEDLASVTQDIATRLVHSDCTKAISWYDQLPEIRKQAAMRGIAQEMAKGNINELGKWLGSRSQDENWKTGVLVFINHLKNTDVEMAREWEGSLRSFEESRKN